MLAFTHDCVCTYTDERTEIKEGPIDLLTGQADKQAVVLKVEARVLQDWGRKV